MCALFIWHKHWIKRWIDWIFAFFSIFCLLFVRTLDGGTSLAMHYGPPAEESYINWINAVLSVDAVCLGAKWLEEFNLARWRFVVLFSVINRCDMQKWHATRQRQCLLSPQRMRNCNLIDRFATLLAVFVPAFVCVLVWPQSTTTKWYLDWFRFKSYEHYNFKYQHSKKMVK